MKKFIFLLSSLLISSGVLFAKGTKTDGTVIGRVDRSAWKAIACSSERADDGGGIAGLFDGNHNNFWHSQWGPDVQPPHWVIIDLGENGAREFTAFQIYKRYNTGVYQKTVEVYVGDEPAELAEGSLPADNGWTLIGEGLHPNSGAFRMLTVETPGSAANQGRYLLFYFPDTYNTFACVAEIYGLGQIEDNLYQGTPYPGPNGHAVPGIIEAEDFDKGGQGVGYSWFDADIRHNQAYIDSVLLEEPDRTFDYSNYRWDAEDGEAYILDGPGDGNHHLGHFSTPGEYLNYTIDVAESTHYDLSFLAAVDGADRYFQVLLDGMPLLQDPDYLLDDKPVNVENGFYPITNTGSWSKYVDNVIGKAYITAGKHVLRVYGHFDFDKITIKKAYIGQPFNGTHTLPCIIQAEDFDEGAAGMTYHIATPSTNTYRPTTPANIATGPAGEEGEDNYHLVTGNGDWYKYTLNVPKDKFYDYVFFFHGERKAASNSLTLEINGEVIPELTDFIDFPSAYGDPSEVYMPITLQEGINVITVKTNGGNLDKIEIQKAPFDYKGRPFLGEPFFVSLSGTTTIEAEDFDIGGEGISFHDGNNNSPDLSKEYRGEAGDGSENVFIENIYGGRTSIGSVNSGDFLAYTLDVEEDGIYDVFIVASTNGTDMKNHIEIDDVAYPEITLHTSGWSDFSEFCVSNVTLKAGRRILYMYIENNFDKIIIKQHSDRFPYDHNPQTIPGVIQAWQFDEGGDGLTYGVTNKTLGGTNNAIRENVLVPIKGNEADGYYIDVVESGTPSFLLYTTDIKETGYYKITYKVECNAGGESLTISGKSGANAKVVLPNDAPGEWRDVSFPITKIKAGTDTLRLAVTGSGIKIASVKFELIDNYIDRSNWTVEVSDETASDGGGKAAILDDDFGTYWHSQWQPSNAELPHWAIFDLGSPVEISQIITIRRSNGDTKSLQYSVSNDLNSDVWTIIAEGEYAVQSDGIHDLTLDATQIVKARYLKLFLEDSYREPFTGIAEVYAIGKSYPVNPFNGPHTVPGIVEAEDFNTGGEGNAFHAGNPGAGNTYRPEEAANIVAIDGGYSLVTATGDWYTYTIEVPNKDYNYDFVIYGEKASANTLILQVNGKAVEGVTDVINFPGAYNTPTIAGPVKLTKGKNTITIKADGGSLDKLEIRPAEYQGQPFLGTAFAVPGKIEVENFDLGGEGIAFHDVNPAITTDWTAYRPELEGGPYLEKLSTTYTIGGTQPNEWIAYTVEFPETGLYDFTLHVSTSNQDRVAGLSIDYGPSDTTTVRTTGWSDFQDFTIKNVSATAGIHQVYLEFTEINSDYFEIAKSTTAIKELPTLPGKVYTEGGVLKVKEFPTTTSLAVYNLFGQKIANYKAVNSGVEVYLPSKGIYIVKLQYQGITETHKVIAK